jgi:acid phosphatase type 7
VRTPGSDLGSTQWEGTEEGSRRRRGQAQRRPALGAEHLRERRGQGSRCGLAPGLALALLLVSAALPQAATAQTSVTLTPAAGAPGATVSVKGIGFGVRDRVSVRLGRKTLARAATNRSGSFKRSFRVPRGGSRSLRIVSSSRSLRLVNLFRVSRSEQARKVSEVTTRGGARLRWSPSQGPSGSTIDLRGSRLPARSRVHINFGGAPAERSRTDRRGRLSVRLVVPRLSSGRHRVRVRAGSRALTFGFTVAASPPAGGRTVPRPATAAPEASRPAGSKPSTVSPTPVTGPPLPAPGLDPQPSFPIRATFYYPWFPEAWTQNGIHPYTRWSPSLGLYDSGSAAVIERHLRNLEWGGIEVGISSWGGAGTTTDARLPTILSTTNAAGSPVRWTVYYQQESQGEPSLSKVRADLAYIRDRYASHSAYFRVSGRFVVFVSGGQGDSCATADRWSEANVGIGAYLILEAFSGYQDCASQPDGWHRYDPAQPVSAQPQYWYSISPGLWRPDEPTAQLERRSVAEWQQAVRDMVASEAPFQLVTTFNRWGDGSSVEPAAEWTTAGCTVACHGTYLTALRRDGQPGPPPQPPPPDPVIAAAGDIACDPLSSSFNSGFGTPTACRQLHTSDLLVGRDLAAVLPIGDLQYPNGELADFQQSYHPSWGRFKALTHPVPGNHEYRTSGAAGYFDYFNGPGNADGPAGERGKGYYSYDVGSWHLIALNSSCSDAGGCSAGSPQERWLRAELESNQADCTLAYWHHPRFSSGPHGSDQDTQPLWRALWEGGAEAVLSGHDHTYERFAPQDARGALDGTYGVRQFVAGTGGKELYSFTSIQPNSRVRDQSSYGVLVLTLHSDSYDWRFEPAAGSSFSDAGSARCHGDPPPAPPTGISAKPGAGRVDLAWDANTEGDFDHYRLRRATSPGGPFTEIAVGLRTTSYADTSLDNGTTYHYELDACDRRGTCSAPATASATPQAAP